MAGLSTSALAGMDAPDREAEQRMLLFADWGLYCQLREALRPSQRLSYWRGALEIMSVSSRHEQRKTLISRLLEAWALERGIGLNSFGNTTFQRPDEAGLEPDACYTLERGLKDASGREVPDLAIEICVTRTLIDKFPIYHALGVDELWVHEPGGVQVFVRQGDTYSASSTSELFPTLDLALLSSFVDCEDMTAAVRAFLASCE